MTNQITSTANPRIKGLARLRRRRHREERGETLVEGFEELALALGAGAVPITVYHCAELSRPGELDALRARPGFTQAELIEVNRPVFDKIAYRESPDGWLAVLPSVHTELADLQPGAQPLLLICEGVEKPGNLGAMLRTADAAGVTAVIATDPGTDWGNPNVVRASKGAVYALPVVSADTAEVLAWLAERDIPVLAATPEGAAVYTELDLRGPLAIAVGEEKHGLSQAWLDAARWRALIPMSGLVDSLNVSTSAAILLYEAVRQRTQPAR
ncbi:MAG TPA: RNA methyltransferase [Pseudonocardia sp.]|uniref:TrmH family RNA methyltransferase n=1 Tax=Pseudonocardia sp. TaxID=60912 RepID=UPI002CD6EB8C|nr:RNA methyltransferase [Pseudonocardia sp.]HTF48948.1 RNA methyltransferase [Pseudonocardia sp.]